MPHMKSLSAVSLAVLVALPLGLSACSTGHTATTPSPTSTESSVSHSLPTPTMKTAQELRDATVQIAPDGQLVLDVGTLAADSYTATVADAKVVKFVPGSTSKDGKVTRPTFEPLAKGTTKVTLSNKDTSIAPVTFTIEVAAASSK